MLYTNILNYVLFLFSYSSLCYAQTEVEESSLEEEQYEPASSGSGSARVGEKCSSNTDCVLGAFCDSSVCRCWTTHVPLERYCWKKISPEEPGCTYDEQCDAVWPGAKCQFSLCRCPSNMKAAVTREGAVCHMPGHCPTNGANSLLYNRNTNTPAQCYFFDGEVRAGRFIGCDDYPEVHDCIDGLCCPTRALTCIQSMDNGDTSNETVISIDRWYHNPITHSCQEFRFTGSGGNSNNFLSREQCESYCIMRCERGQPQLDPSISESSPLSSSAVTCSTQPDICDSDKFECTKMEGNALCCPSVEFICSEFGGVSSDSIVVDGPTTSLPFSSGSNRNSQISVSRWYYDPPSKSCRTFKYYGQGGNFNNFLSEEHCLSFCSKVLCPMGSPLRDASGSYITCSSGDHCPRTHTCNDGVCCPSAGTLCNQPLSTGAPCQSSSTPRYWFNAAVGSCQLFEFTGCQGNGNNFRTMEQCQYLCGKVEVEPRCPYGEALQIEGGRFWRCGQTNLEGQCPSNYHCHYDGHNYGCCPTRSYTCSLAQDTGRQCSPGLSLRWFYDTTSQTCRSFHYKGCDGNSNNFPSQKDCQEYCRQSGCPNGGDAMRDPSGHTVTCSSKNECPSTHQCTRMVLPGVTATTRYCCPTRQTVCSEGFDTGDACGPPMRRYFFDGASHVCRPFSFLGCAGNSNNFASKMACFNYCQSAACATSEVVYQSSSSDAPFDCTAKSCPKGYACVRDVWIPERRVCCGAPNFGVCPSEQRPFVDFRTQQPLPCTANQRGGCPESFQCLFNPERNSFFCCGEAVRKDSCPEGAKLVRLPQTGDPAGCSLSSQCPDGSSCHQPDTFRTGVCCRNLDSVCPPTFSLDKELTDRGECSPLERDSCSPDRQSVCLFSEKLHRFVCCRREEKQVQTIEKCPLGSVQDSHRVYCAVDKACPSTHFCVRRDSDRVGICCRHPKLGRERPPTTPRSPRLRCPAGLASLVDVRTSEAQLCSNKYPCPTPYQCTPIQRESATRVCCARDELVSQFCAEGTPPLSIDGHIYSCHIKNCPPGYRCTKDMCCATKELSCNEPLYLGTNCNDDDERGIRRYYFDPDNRRCSPFDYRGCNANSNNFKDEKSCIEMCREDITIKEKKKEIIKETVIEPKKGKIIEKDKDSMEETEVTTVDPDAPINIQCPPPYLNPSDWPQMCEQHRESCAAHEKCVQLSNGANVCCVRPASSSLRSLMMKMCGDSFAPVLTRTGDPRRCGRRSPCAMGQICHFSTVLMIDICCFREDLLFSQISHPIIERSRSKATRIKVCGKNAEGIRLESGCLPRLYPGDTICAYNEQCMGQSRCVGGMCVCQPGHVMFQRMCYWKCPPYYRNISGVCI